VIDRGAFNAICKEFNLIFWDDCEQAIIGLAGRCGQDPLVVYDRDKLIKVFMEKGLTEEESEEWINFNIEGAFVGESTPLILEKIID
tara:strand:+ start:245 stop:505 length:261 start_codon:yes stop_codon:yes gene_type:complete